MLNDWNGEGFLFKTSGQGRTLGWTSSPGEFSSFCPIRFLTMDAVQSWVANLFHFLPTGILKFVTWVLGSNLFRRPNELHWLTPGHLEKIVALKSFEYHIISLRNHESKMILFIRIKGIIYAFVVLFLCQKAQANVASSWYWWGNETDSWEHCESPKMWTCTKVPVNRFGMKTRSSPW